ncbi:hemin uptake protein HemP [Rhodanobacter sp. DHB23]|uniref:hemin uptake protein HemP n=1 Tax=Rhodanobacter sp. DHB23 TaxID=2775923 RepID=UPI001780807E|nr:hemin uptake protein HemP [Rhodanobacter sp. DHB23]MBD8871576.1 hemin uptake protein HemP [Rhodanobacter sp. DHB23]
MSIATTLSLPTVASRLTRPLSRLSLHPAAAGTPPVVRRVSSQSLLDGGRELVIQHEGSEYHLRLTRKDKLILTK